MLYKIQCWVRRVIFRRRYYLVGRKSLESKLELAISRVNSLEAECRLQRHDLNIAAHHGLWRWSHPLAAHFQTNPEMVRIMKSRFEKQQAACVKQVVDLGPVKLQLNQS
jgi:hypothetical protein